MSTDRTRAFLWDGPPTPVRGPRRGLSPELIATAALDIAAVEGAAALSMQRVADAFGFTAMALYRYVPSKAALIALTVDTAIGPRPQLGPGGWSERLHAWARAVRDRFVVHPWLLAVTNPPRVLGPNEMGWVDACYAVLAETGLPEGERTATFLALTGHVRGVAELGVGDAAAEAEHAVMAECLARRAAEFPALAGIGVPSMDTGPDPLEFGLRCLLDGLAQRIERLPD